MNTAPPIVIVADAGSASNDHGVHAWTTGLTPGTWPISSLPISFYVALPKSRDIGNDEADELNVALRSWPAASCTSFRYAFAGSTNAPAGDDGINAVYFHDDSWPADLPPNAIATTVIHTDSSGKYHDADIHLNGANYTFSLDGHAGTIDVRSIFTHELGHALGLGHSTDLHATMFATYSSGVAWRSIEQDDVNGVCALYPGSGETTGCESNPCPSPNFVCVAKVCERKGTLREVCSPCDPNASACDGAGDSARCLTLPLGGNVCGRGCSIDSDCGENFHCRSTTEAGDFQCVPDDGCANGPDLCTTANDCSPNACKNGVCVGSSANVPDSGTSADASSPIAEASGGCSIAVGNDSYAWGWIGLAFFLKRNQRAKQRSIKRVTTSKRPPALP